MMPNLGAEEVAHDIKLLTGLVRDFGPSLCPCYSGELRANDLLTAQAPTLGDQPMKISGPEQFALCAKRLRETAANLSLKYHTYADERGWTIATCVDCGCEWPRELSADCPACWVKRRWP